MKKFFALCAAYVFSIVMITFVFPKKEVMCRVIVISCYLFIIILCRYIYKLKLIDLVSKISYYSNFKSNNEANHYLKYVYRSASLLFISGLLLTFIFHLLKMTIFIDIIVFLVLLFVWAILGYRYSKKINHIWMIVCIFTIYWTVLMLRNDHKHVNMQLNFQI